MDAPDFSALNNSLLTENTGFNARLQPLSIATTMGATNMLSLTYNYCADFSDINSGVTCASNNGNVTRQQIGFDAVNGAPSFAETQVYQYNDPANRLTQASGAPTPTAGANWSESNAFDAVGNRWVPSATGIVLAADTPVTSSWITSQNRINSWNYDAMGNLTGSLPTGSPPVFGRTFVYDAENRQVQATINGAQSTYTYDGDGRRVMSVTPNATTTFVYDADGQLAQEYSTAASTVNGPAYLSVDHLGSTRLVTDVNGNVLKRYDYLPFGEELTAGIDGRTTSMEYNTGLSATLPDVEPIKFTSKERDAETGLDFFLARYYSGAQGRFTSPDAPLADQDPRDPQSWNLYGYVRNNPLRFTDPTGTTCVHSTGSDGSVTTTDDGDGKGCGELQQPVVVHDTEPPSPLLLAVATGAQRAGPAVNAAAGATAVVAGGIAAGIAYGAYTGGTALISLGVASGPLVGLLPEERQIAEELIAQGHTVTAIPRAAGKTADFLIDGIVTEFKSLNSAGTNTLKNAIQKAAQQSGEDILIDARKVPISAQEALQQIQRAQGNIQNLQGRVTVLTKDGPVKF